MQFCIGTYYNNNGNLELKGIPIYNLIFCQFFRELLHTILKNKDFLSRSCGKGKRNFQAEERKQALVVRGIYRGFICFAGEWGGGLAKVQVPSNINAD